MSSDLKLSEDEKSKEFQLKLSIKKKFHLAAKNFIMNLLLKGFKFSEPCDECLNEESFQLPKWYDDVKFKR